MIIFNNIKYTKLVSRCLYKAPNWKTISLLKVIFGCELLIAINVNVINVDIRVDMFDSDTKRKLHPCFNTV